MSAKAVTVPVYLQYSHTVDRPLPEVFRFVATEHVRNHPRWDTDIELEQVTEGPLRVGSIIRRRNKRSGTPVDGSMEVIELEPNQSIGTIIVDGPLEFRGRITFEALGNSRTMITRIVDIPGLDDSMIDKSHLLSRLEETSRVMNVMLEAEIQPI